MLRRYRKQLLLGLVGTLCVLALSSARPCREAFGQVDESGQKTVKMDFDQVELKVFIKFISNLTGKNFLVDDKVKGTVTIISPEPVTEKEAYKVFQSVLEVHGYTTVPSGNVTKIVRTVEARQKSVDTGTGIDYQPSPEDRVITRIIPLDFASSQDLRKVLTSMVSKQGLLVAYNPTNTLILTDYQSNIQRIMRIIGKVDVSTFTEHLAVVQLENATADTLVQNLKSLLAAGQKGARLIQRGNVSIVPDSRTNSILLMADEENMDKLRSMIRKLDRPTPKQLSNIEVIPLENAQAENVAKILSSLAGKKGDAKGESPISRNVSIEADKSTNSLVVIAEPKELKNLKPIVEKLDMPRRQVYVEAAIIEVTTDTTLNLGVNWQFGSDFGGGDVDGAFFGTSNGPAGQNLEDITNRLAQNAAGLSFGVLSFPFTFQGEEFFSLGAFINASQQDNNVHIISTPQLMTMENEEATVTVAENRPFLTSRETTEAGRDFNNFEYKDVGVTLKVTPLINNKGWIKLSLFQEVSRVDPTQTQAIQATTPVTRKRTAETTVRVKDGQTVVIAGLMEDRDTNNQSKVPGLGDVPLLGKLFQNNFRESSKTNLMVFITPRIVQNQKKARSLTYDKSRILNKLRFGVDGSVMPIPEDFILFQPLR
jgi:general secretion pathway protein D